VRRVGLTTRRNGRHYALSGNPAGIAARSFLIHVPNTSFTNSSTSLCGRCSVTRAAAGSPPHSPPRGPRSDRFRCVGRESNFLQAISSPPTHREKTSAWLRFALRARSPAALGRLGTAPVTHDVLRQNRRRLHCPDCGHEKLLAFTCKSRHFCLACHSAASGRPADGPGTHNWFKARSHEFGQKLRAWRKARGLRQLDACAVLSLPRDQGLICRYERGEASPRRERMVLEARIQSFELAYRMQMEASDAFDIMKEPEAVRQMYGVKPGPEGSFARQCLIARRLLERGVRFLQLWTGDGQPWDKGGMPQLLFELARGRSAETGLPFSFLPFDYSAVGTQ